MYLARTTAPAVTPVSLSEAKAHLRVLTTDEDTLITSLISAATEYLDGRHGILGRALITQAWEYRFDRFPLSQCFQIPLPPLQSVEAVKYIDDNGVEQTLATDQYVVETAEFVGRIRAAYDVTWPTTRVEENAVRVEFTAGFGSAGSDVPEGLRQAILLLIGHFYLNREAVSEKSMMPVPMAVDSLIGPYRFEVM